MKAILIDDELSARSTLTKLIQDYFPNVIQILEVCDSPKSGIEAINKYSPDLVFLDVEMPEMTGFEMLKQVGFPNIKFQLIFCTAHGHYAVQAFRFSAVDFLLKPIQIEQLIESILKVKENLMRNQHDLDVQKYTSLLDNINKEQSPDGYENRSLVLSTSDGVLFVNSDDVIRLEADGNYTTFHLLNHRPIFIAKQLGDFDERRPFFRVHRSHSINPKHILKTTKTEGFQLYMRDGSVIDVAKSKKEDVQNLLKDFFGNPN